MTRGEHTKEAKIIKVDGTETVCRYPKKDMTALAELIGCEMLCTVNLRDGRVMLVDDNGVAERKPVNDKATKLYHGVCVPGTTHKIRGDVAIVIDADFE